MNRICSGCGVILQSKDKEKEGYVTENKLNEALYCERCFKLKNYGKVENTEININGLNAIKKLKKEKKCILYLVDLINVSSNVKEHLELLDKNDYIVLTKRDALPKSVKDEKIIKYFKENYINTDNLLIVSSFKKLNIDKLLAALKASKSKEAYIVGNSNSGKSTLLNAILNSMGLASQIVTSRTLNTTMDNIEIKINETLKLIDTPGFNCPTIEKYLSLNEIKKLQVKKEIKVKTIQLKPNYSIYIENYFRLDYLGKDINSFSIYASNSLNIKTKKIIIDTKLKKIHLTINESSDIVINGLVFIKVTKPCEIDVYTYDANLISIRKNII